MMRLGREVLYLDEHQRVLRVKLAGSLSCQIKR